MVTTVPFDSSESSLAADHAPRRGHREVALIVAEALLAVGALAGAVGLIGGGIDLGDTAEDLPFGSPALGGVALAAVCGALPTVVAAAAWRRAPLATFGHVVVGVALVGWIVAQVGLIGLGSWLQVAYAIFGLGITALAISNLRASRPPTETGPERPWSG
jgi:hypothetical protein